MSTLLAGDTDWWSDELIAQAFGADENVTVLGDRTARRTGAIRALEIADPSELSEAIRVGYERVVYFSNELTFGSEPEDEFSRLTQLLDGISEQPDTKVLFVSSDAIDDKITTSVTVRQQALESLCRWHRRQGMDLVTLRVPYLSSTFCDKDYWLRVCRGVRSHKSWTFPVNADQPFDFVDMRDVADLVNTIFGSWPSTAILRLQATGNHTFSEASQKIAGRAPSAALSFASVPVNALRGSVEEKSVRDVCGFACTHDVFDQIDAMWEQTDTATVQEQSLSARIRQVFRAGSPALIVAELVLGLVLVQWLNGVLGNYAQFRMIDLRLIYVMLFGATYGVRTGVIASVLMAVSLGWSFTAAGHAPIQLIANPQNWIPLVLYFVVGTSLGYMRRKAENDRRFADERAEALKKRNKFISGLYDQACESRNEYRHNLLASRDGFGRIFDVVKKLSQEEPSKIFSASIGVLEDVLDTKKAAIYVINDRADGYARLVVSSTGLNGHLAKSVRLEDYRFAMDALEAGEVWFNSSLDPALPSYVAGVKSGGELRVLIMIYDVPFKQASSYYMNLVRILSGLMENFLIHAWHDEEAREAERHVPGTYLLTRPELLKELDVLRDMRRQHVSDYRILEIDRQGKTVQETAEQLRSAVRSSDTVGVGKDDRVYLLLRQVDDAVLPIVLNRFAKAGIPVSVCTDEDQI